MTINSPCCLLAEGENYPCKMLPPGRHWQNTENQVCCITLIDRTVAYNSVVQKNFTSNLTTLMTQEKILLQFKNSSLWWFDLFVFTLIYIGHSKLGIKLFKEKNVLNLSSAHKPSDIFTKKIECAKCCTKRINITLRKIMLHCSPSLDFPNLIYSKIFLC